MLNYSVWHFLFYEHCMSIYQQQSTVRIFILFIGLSILGYLLPYHSPLGRDFLVNSYSFVYVAVGLACFFWQSPIDKERIHLSVWSWLSFAVLLGLQGLFLDIAYPDALIFPIASLLVVALVAVASSQIVDRALLLNRLFVFAYIMAIATFIIQIAQINNWTYSIGGWVVVRDNALPTRLDGNFGQANHTGYGFVLALCGVIYQLHQSFIRQKNQNISTKYQTLYRGILVLLFVMFTAGLAWTQSRAGLVMMLAVIAVYFFAQSIGWQKKFGLVAMGYAFFGLYYLGASWLGSLMLGQTSLGAVSRMAGGQGNRVALHERGMMMFGDNPLFGVGWNNYMKASIDYAQSFQWPEIADHTHNFVSMILAEMGLIGALCCLPIVWVLVRAVHFRHSSESAIALAFVLASLLYASVEYPLWYFRYLVIFALLLALVEPKNFVVKLNRQSWSVFGFNGVFAVFSGVMAVAGIFYANQYLKLDYLNYSRFTTHKNHTFKDDDINYQQGLFGFSAYHERILAMKVPISGVNLDKKLPIFADVLNNDSSQFNILAYAQLLVFKGEKDKAFTYIQASCIMVRDLSFCDNVDSDLSKLAKNHPEYFDDLYQRFVAWREQNPEKTGLNIKSEIFDN